jgi:hypothetical protein
MWARRTLVRATMLAAAIAGSICTVFLFAAPTMLHLWVGKTIQAPFMLLLGFAVWRTIEASVGASSMYLNGLRAMRFQVAIAAMTALAAITIKLLFVRTLGIAIMPWATITAYALFAGPPIIFFLRRHA